MTTLLAFVVSIGLCAAASAAEVKVPGEGRVQYDLVLELAGEAIRQRNVNYFFAHKSRWVDVHASIIGYGKDDARVLAAFDKSLAYGAETRKRSPKRR